MLTQEQQQVRKHGIGGSEIAAVAGLNPWMSPLDVYLRKRGLVDDAPSKHTERGNFFEPAVLNWYAHRTGSKLESPGTLRHPEHELVIATPDAAAERDGCRRGVEVKMPGRYTIHHWGEPGTEDVPDYYVPQTQWEAAVLGAPIVDLVTVRDDDLVIYPIRFDVELFGALHDIAQRFWRDHIEADNPPPPNGSERAREWLLQRYPRATSSIVEATEEMAQLAREYCAARDAENAASERKSLAANRLRALLGERSGAQCQGMSISYKNNKDSTTTDWQAIAEELRCPQSLVQKHTRVRTGARVLRVTLKGT